MALRRPPSVPGLHLVRVDGKGLGVVARRPFAAGERLLRFVGPVLTREQVTDFARALQVGRDLFLGPSGGIDDFVNHSCQPNGGLRPAAEHPFVDLLALRAVAAGEELTFDYSTSMQIEPPLAGCRCGAPRCRGVVQPFAALAPGLQAELVERGLVLPFLLTPVLATVLGNGHGPAGHGRVANGRAPASGRRATGGPGPHEGGAAPNGHAPAGAGQTDARPKGPRTGPRLLVPPGRDDGAGEAGTASPVPRARARRRRQA